MSALTYTPKRISAAIVLGLAGVMAALAMAFPVHGEAAAGYYFELASDPSVSCVTAHNASGGVTSRMIFVHLPSMFSGPFNTVSYQPILWQSNGSSWQFVLNGPELHGGQGLYGLPDHAGFIINQPGRYYRASIVLRWYSAAGVLVNVEHVWAGSHQLFRVLANRQKQVMSGLQQYCYMP